MKLLFDENLSPKLPRLIAASFSNSQHVRELGLKGRTDEEIWAFAKTNGFTIISKD
jgi:predicted nuclease of predicted toxin-antitoxin system